MAIGELPREAPALEEPLPTRELAGLPRRPPRLRCLDGLGDERLSYARVLLEELGELLVDGALDLALHLGVAELPLRLALELGLEDLHREDAGEPFADVLAG